MPNNDDFPNLGGLIPESLSDGRGVRMAIFLTGCSHGCEKCHNAFLQPAHMGLPITSGVVESLADTYRKHEAVLSGITLTGGDPLFDAAKTESFLRKFIRELGKTPNVWLYTGYRFEEIKDLPILDLVDVVVDGEFVWRLADKRLAFRGSSNQRIMVKTTDGFVDMSKEFDGGTYGNCW